MGVERKVGRRVERMQRKQEKYDRYFERRRPITVDRIVDVALEIVAAEGFDALTMRRVAAAHETGPASLYAHVDNKADLDDLLIGRVVSRIALPEPEPEKWREQTLDVCGRIRDIYTQYPGLSRASLAVVPTNRDTLRISEGMLAILLAGGVDAQTAAWGIDALSLYVSGYCLEQSMWVAKMRGNDGWQDFIVRLQETFDDLPVAEFPHTKNVFRELTAGDDHERFDFAVSTMINGFGGRKGKPLPLPHATHRRR